MIEAPPFKTPDQFSPFGDQSPPFEIEVVKCLPQKEEYEIWGNPLEGNLRLISEEEYMPYHEAALKEAIGRYNSAYEAGVGGKELAQLEDEMESLYTFIENHGKLAGLCIFVYSPQEDTARIIKCSSEAIAREIKDRWTDAQKAYV